MKRGVMIALIALATTAAMYAGNGNKKSKVKSKPKTECCDKTRCCPAGTSICKD